jgi:hypothetical protein
MTVSADVKTNALIVSAPDPLFKEVQDFVKIFDQASTDINDYTTIITLKKTNPALIQAALAPIVGPQITATSTTTPQGAPQASSAQGTQTMQAGGRGQTGRGQTMGGNSGQPDIASQIRQSQDVISGARGAGGSTRGGGSGFGGRGSGGNTGGTSGRGGRGGGR